MLHEGTLWQYVWVLFCLCESFCMCVGSVCVCVCRCCWCYYYYGTSTYVWNLFITLKAHGWLFVQYIRRRLSHLSKRRETASLALHTIDPEWSGSRKFLIDFRYSTQNTAADVVKATSIAINRRHLRNWRQNHSKRDDVFEPPQELYARSQ